MNFTGRFYWWTYASNWPIRSTSSAATFSNIQYPWITWNKKLFSIRERIILTPQVLDCKFVFHVNKELVTTLLTQERQSCPIGNTCVIMPLIDIPKQVRNWLAGAQLVFCHTEFNTGYRNWPGACISKWISRPWPETAAKFLSESCKTNKSGTKNSGLQEDCLEGT